MNTTTRGDTRLHIPSRSSDEPSWLARVSRAPRHSATLENWVAMLLCVLIGMRYPRHEDIQAPFVIALLLLPLWAGSLRRFRWARVITVLGGVTILSGIVLSIAQGPSHQISSSHGLMMSARVAGLILCAGFLLWARERLGTATMALWVGVGMVVGIPFNGSLDENPWKFAISVPLAILVLGLAWRLGRRWLEIAALVCLSGVSAISDSRSAAVIFFSAAVLLATQSVNVRRRMSAWWVIGRMAVLAGLIYLIAQAAILDGYLGSATQARSIAQLDTSGSLITGGRPELGATLALIQLRPFGYGSGTMLSLNEVMVAKSGMATLGYDPNNGYVENYMFGNGIEVHSVIGDIWLQFGLLGMIFLLVAIAATLFAVAQRLGMHRASGLELFLAVETLWNLAFSPLPSSVLTLTLFLAVALAHRKPRHANSDVDGAPPLYPPSHPHSPAHSPRGLMA